MSVRGAFSRSLIGEGGAENNRFASKAPNALTFFLNAAAFCGVAAAEAALRNPIIGIAGCCARAPSGHAAAAPPRAPLQSVHRSPPAFSSLRAVLQLPLGMHM
jgi:hypothetical protein